MSLMGSSLSKALGRLFGNREVRILMLGLDAAGKTTILFRLKFNHSSTTVPTVGFNKEFVQYKNIKFNVWDVGGQEKIQQLWRHYYAGAQGLIFVVDSANVERLDDAREALFNIVNDPEMSNVSVLVFGNKQDLPTALSPKELTAKLELTKLRGRDWCLVASCAKTGEGLLEGLSWLAKHIPKPKN